MRGEAMDHRSRRGRPRWRGVGVVAVVAALVGAALPTAPASAELTTVVPREDTWVTNGRVWSIIERGEHIYLGGNFTALGPNTGHGVNIDDQQGRLLPGSPKVNSSIFDAVDDGAGGLFIVGAFDTVNGIPRGRAAHIRADGSVGPFDPAANGTIREIARLGNTLVLGGEFTTIQGVPRARLALVNLVGAPLGSWTADANGPVEEIVVSSDGLRIFVGGSFSTVRGVNRGNVASLVATSGVVENWAPIANGRVDAIALDGGRVYLGGAFTSVGLVPRQGLALVDASTGLTDPLWVANVNDGVVRAMTLQNGTLYFGGTFTKVKNVNRPYVAAVTSDAVLTPWNPAANQAVNTIVASPDGAALYLGGAFTSVRFAPRNRLARVDKLNGALLGPLDPAAIAQVWVVHPRLGQLFIGGDFASVGIVHRAYLARLDRVTGALDSSFAPSLDGFVETMDMTWDGAELYLGGRFTSVNGTVRNKAASLNVPQGTLTRFNPNVNGIAVQAIDHRDGKVVMGGQFGSVSGVPLRNAARTDADTGAPDVGWAPNPNKQVRDVDILSDRDVILGGDFTTVGILLTPRAYLAEIDGQTGAATGWAPAPSNLVYEGALTANESRYYAAILGPGGTGGNAVEAFSTAPAGDRLWRVATNGDVQALDLSPDEQTVYAGGHFFVVYQGSTTIRLDDRNRMMALRATTGALLPWRPRLDLGGTGVFAVTATNNGVYIGGDFNRVGPTSTRGLAVFPGTP